jgi:hypothetical protein
MRRTYSRLPWLVLLAGLAMIATGLVGWWGEAVATPQRGAIPPAALAAPAAGTAAPPEVPVETPQELRLPSLNIAAPVVPVDVGAGRALSVPDDPHVLGWWRGGARPGGGQGTVVIDGHVDSARGGPGALFGLRELRPGDRVQLRTDHGTHDYQVRALRSFRKISLPPEVFSTEGQPRLVLITCGGTFDQHTREYTDNLVAYAVPA